MTSFPIADNIKYELITPEIASRLLMSTPKTLNVRDLSHGHSKRYEYCMANNKWEGRTSSPIGINSEGQLVNGQTRLEACVKSQKSIWQIVLYNVTESEVKAMDQGFNRTPRLVLGVPGKYLEILNSIKDYGSVNAPTKNKMALPQQELFVNKYRDILNEVVEMKPKSRFGDAIELAPCVRAIIAGYHPEKVKHFIRVMKGDYNGISDNQLTIVDKLKDYLTPSRKSGPVERPNTTKIIEQSIQSFVEDTKLKRYRITDHKSKWVFDFNTLDLTPFRIIRKGNNNG